MSDFIYQTFYRQERGIVWTAMILCIINKEGDKLYSSDILQRGRNWKEAGYLKVASRNMFYDERGETCAY